MGRDAPSSSATKGRQASLPFPAMAQEDHTQLAASIRENGWLEPVTGWRGRTIQKEGNHLGTWNRDFRVLGDPGQV